MSSPTKLPKPCTTVELIHWIRPYQVDDRGVALAGEILAYIDICAGVAAKRHAEYPTVTASVDAVHFLAPGGLIWSSEIG